MKYLILETNALKPHLETAGELAFRLKDEGAAVFYSWLGSDLPWSDWNLPWHLKFIGCSLDKRLNDFSDLLLDSDISILDKPNISDQVVIEISDWASSFTGGLDQLKNYKYKEKLLGMGVASSLISFYSDSLYPVQEKFPEVRMALFSAALVYERAFALISMSAPDYVVTFNGRFATAKPIVLAAQELKVKVIRHERGSTFERYETFTDAIHNYEYIKLRINDHWASTNKCDRGLNAKSFFERKRGGDGIGWHSFTEKQISGFVPAKKNGCRRVVYFSSSDDEYAAVTDVYKPGPWSNQLTAVNALIDLCNSIENIELVIRVHPHLSKKSKKEQERWRVFESSERLIYIAPSNPVDSYSLLDSADVVVTYGSTIGIEAAYWGKPSVLLGPSSYRDTSSVFSPSSNDELLRLLLNIDLVVPDKDFCLKYGNYYLTYGSLFEYYRPSSLSDGLLKGKRLGWDPDLLYKSRKLFFSKIVKTIIKYITFS